MVSGDESGHETAPRSHGVDAITSRICVLRFAGLDVMSIRPELRRELLALLVDESLDPEWERAWSNEVRQRFQAVSENRVELIDADDVHRDLRADLRDPRR